MRALLFLLFLASFHATAQTDNSDLQAMIDTENAFAKLAKDQNQKMAFLQYMSDSVITTAAAGIRFGKDHLHKQVVRPTLLSWQVDFADIAASGDLGYTTGPWQFRKDKSDKDPVAFGEFNSVWKKQNDGQWKNILDVGTSHPSVSGVPNLKTNHVAARKPTPNSPAGVREIRDIENKFIAASSADRAAAYTSYLSANARICHEGFLPVTSPEEIKKFVQAQLLKVTYTMITGAVASSGDLAFTAGNAEVEIVANGTTESKKGAFVHIWKREEGGWKIVLDVLTHP